MIVCLDPQQLHITFRAHSIAVNRATIYSGEPGLSSVCITVHYCALLCITVHYCALLCITVHYCEVVSVRGCCLMASVALVD